MKKHIREIHDKEKQFKCEKCPSTFKRAEHLKKHISCVHDKTKNFKCDMCEKVFNRAGHLKVHVKQVHDKVRDNKCEMCDKAYSDRGDLRKHIQVAHNKEEVTCHICNKVLLKLSLRDHIQGDPNQNLLFQLALSQNVGIPDPMLLVKPKCV